MSLIQTKDEFPIICSNKDNMDDIIGLPITKDLIFNKSNTIYGGSGMGKTTLVKYLMFLLQDVIGTAIVFCPSAKGSNRDYDGCLPEPLIHTEIDTKLFIKIANLQQVRLTKYKYVENRNNIIKLYSYFPNKSIDSTVARLRRSYKNSINRTKQNIKKDDDCDEIEKEYLKIKDTIENFIHKTYISNIIKNKSHYDLTTLPKDLKITLKYIDLNPYSLIIFDDCTEELKNICKRAEKDDNCKEFWKFYTQGRHNGITIITIAHNQGSMAKGIRLNSHNSFFADELSAGAFFNIQNDLDSPLCKWVKFHIPNIYKNKKLHKYNKLCYCKFNNPPVFYTHTPNPKLYENNIRMCASTVHHTLKKYTKKNDDKNISDNNIFKDRFNDD